MLVVVFMMIVLLVRLVCFSREGELLKLKLGMGLLFVMVFIDIGWGRLLSSVIVVVMLLIG